MCNKQAPGNPNTRLTTDFPPWTVPWTCAQGKRLQTVSHCTGRVIFLKKTGLRGLAVQRNRNNSRNCLPKLTAVKIKGHLSLSAAHTCPFWPHRNAGMTTGSTGRSCLDDHSSSCAHPPPPSRAYNSQDRCVPGVVCFSRSREVLVFVPRWAGYLFDADKISNGTEDRKRKGQVRLPREILKSKFRHPKKI